uniref:snRNA-activating protein complex subunit 1 n=1 Tax=Romanomermis culicivorax TaxID=13658 RepID=A0A915I6L6_ROMCU
MKGCGTSVTPITAGVRSDIERFLQKFIEIASVRFDHFAACFNEMKFHYIFTGRSSEYELREFTEKTLLIALSFCFSPYSFQVNVGGIYLLYSLFNLQPRKYQMQIRITPQQLNNLKRLLNDLREQHHFDTCYVLDKLFRDNAFHICAYPDEHNPLNYHRFENKDDVDKAVENYQNTETFINEFSGDRLIPQLETLHDEYIRLKKRLFQNENLPEALSLINDNTMNAVKKTLNDCEQKLESKPTKGKKNQTEPYNVEVIVEGKSCPVKSQKLKERRSAIKEKAYTDKVANKRSRK